MLMKTVNLTVVQVLSLALVIVYPLAINSINAKNETSLAPCKTSPNVVCGPSPVTAYLVHATPSDSTPRYRIDALKANRRYVQWNKCLVFNSIAQRKMANNSTVYKMHSTSRIGGISAMGKEEREMMVN